MRAREQKKRNRGVAIVFTVTANKKIGRKNTLVALMHRQYEENREKKPKDFENDGSLDGDANQKRKPICSRW